MVITLDLEFSETERTVVVRGDGAELGRMSLEDFARTRPARQLEYEWIAGTFKESFPTDLPTIPARQSPNRSPC